MTFLRGSVFLPRGTPFREKNPWDYVPTIKRELQKTTLVPLPEATVRVILPESGAVVVQGLTNDEGGFFLRVPKKEQYFVEVIFEGKQIALSFVEVQEEKELDIGTIDSLSTAYAFWKKKEMSQGKVVPPPPMAKLKREIERTWKRGQGLEHLRMVKGWEEKIPSSYLDPVSLIQKFHFEYDETAKKLCIEWEAREKVEASLFYRSFHGSRYLQERTPFQRRGRFLLRVHEFEGYLFFLEVRTSNNLLGRTPLHAFRVPIVPVRKMMHFLGRQEGPHATARRIVSAKKHLILLEPGGRKEVGLLLKNALERNFEAELSFSFPRRGDIPRYFIREGFEEIELTLYLPEDHSFLWGPVRESNGVKIALQDWEYLLSRFQKVTPQTSGDYFLEVGYSFPFAEVVAYRDGEYFQLFSNLDLQNPVLLLALRKLDSLALETILYYRGTLNLFGEGLFKDYTIEIDFEGKFEEGVDEENHLEKGWSDCAGKVNLWVNLEMKQRDTDRESK